MLELLDLQRRFGDVVALRSVTMRVEPGRLHGFVGRNGSGKTTTMRVALGLIHPDGGTVCWQGEPVTPEVRRRFGYMPEERGLYPKMHLVDQIAFFGELAGMARAEARTAATGWLERLGLADRLGDEVDSLSLGNQQRVQLAAALVHQPELLVLDEPFSGLDPVGVDVLTGVLQEEAANGVGIVFSSHQLELVEKLCDEVTIVEDGAVVASGPIPELRMAHAQPRLRVELEGGWSQWAEGLPGVRLVDRHNGELVFELADGVDDQGVLDAARAAGRVRTFARVVPTLAEIFRDMLRAGDAATTDGEDGRPASPVPAEVGG